MPLSDVRAIIPVAGVGTRLRPHTHTVPKALINVAGKPILAHILDDLSALGVGRVVLIVGHMGDRIETYVRRHYGHLETEFVEQPDPRGLGHAVYLARAAASGGPVLIDLGDTIIRADLSRLVPGAPSMLGVKEVADPRRYGIVELVEGRVKRLTEKPDKPASNLALVGFYYLKDSALLFECLDELIRRDVRTRGEYQLTDALQLMLERGETMLPLPVDAWFDCGSPETLLLANRELLDRGAPAPHLPGSIVVPPVFVAPDATVEGSILGPHVTVASGAVLRGCSVRNSIVNENAHVEDIFLEDSVIGERAQVRGRRKRLNVGDSSEVELS
ncbi:MAG: NTP transferase domain-containing protein [Candidatus Eisenbacteria bacterium]|nr:NTP transferase domain-containing protein [Candidatus Eisenbacteria bacterium]